MEGLKHKACHYLNSTNNRLESINQKIKSNVTQHFSSLNFFNDLMKCLDSLVLERDHMAAMVFKRCSVNLHPANSCLSKYQQLLTPYAFSFMVKQFDLSSKVKITEKVAAGSSYTTTIIHSKERSLIISESTCNCGFYTAMGLPCRDIFALRKHVNITVLNQSCLLQDGPMLIIRRVIEYYQLMIVI